MVQKYTIFLNLFVAPFQGSWIKIFWAMTFELNVFYEITIGKTQAVSNFALVGGASFGLPCISYGTIFEVTEKGNLVAEVLSNKDRYYINGLPV